jgi:hypothetical protein
MGKAGLLERFPFALVDWKIFQRERLYKLDSAAWNQDCDMLLRFAF